MAAPPRLAGLRVEDFPSIPEDSQEFFGKFIQTLNPFLNDTRNALSGSLSIEQNLAGGYREAVVVVPHETWLPFTFEPTWANFSGYGGPCEYRAEGSRVLTRGLAALTGVAAANSAITTLPAEYRPANQLIFLPFGNFGGVSQGVRVNVLPTGVVEANQGVATISALSMEGLSWEAATPPPPGAFTGPGWPIKLKGLSQPPKAVISIGAKDLGSDAASYNCSLPSWRYDSASNSVVVTRVPGLTPTRKYLLSFLLLP